MPHRCTYNPRLTDDAAKADVASRGIDRLGMTRPWTIAATIVSSAEMRAALEHLARNAHRGMAWIEAPITGAAARILRHAAGFGRVSAVLGRIPVDRPFPDIADHVVHAVAIGREGPH